MPIATQTIPETGPRGSANYGRSTRICVMGATFDTANMGVGALAAGTVKCVLHQWPEAEVFFLDYGKEEKVFTVQVAGREVRVPLVNMRFSKHLFLRNNVSWLLLMAIVAKLSPSKSVRERILGGNPWLKQLAESDVVASMAGGDSFSDIYGMRRLAYVGLPQILALVLGKELVLLPQTLGPFKSWTARRVAKYILGHAKVVYSRDEKGLRQTTKELSLNGNADKFRFSYDVGFALDPMKPAQLNIDGLETKKTTSVPRVGLNVSGLLWIGGYSGKNMFGLRSDYQKLIRRLIEQLIVQHGAEVLLVPHVFGDSEESDTSVCAKLFDELRQKYPGKLGFVRGQYDQGEIKYVIGTCDFFLGARMHACIAALSQGVPAVAVAYSDKFIGVLDTIGMKDAVADPRYMNETEMVEFVERLYRGRASLKQRLERKIPEVRQNVLGLFSNLEV
jgi:colanic acid/amylovoran biosynthesis protein